jgi:protein-tyrosine kinase
MIKIKKTVLNSPDPPAEEQTSAAAAIDDRPDKKEKRAKWIGKFLNFRQSSASPPMEEETTANALAEEHDKPKIGWKSPTYSISRPVQLNPAILEANRCIAHHISDSVEVDAYRILRTKILHHCSSRGGNALMITSAVPGEGKTLTAINLAITMAKDFRNTVLLVDCDLRQQTIHNYLGYESDKGIIDYLLNDTPVSEIITWPGIEKLTIISGGHPISGSSELLGSHRMNDLVTEMKFRYPDRYIIFDVPPLLTNADALAFVPMVDHVLFAVLEGVTPVDKINKALHMVPADKVLGLVLNRQKSIPEIIPYPARKTVATEPFSRGYMTNCS